MSPIRKQQIERILIGVAVLGTLFGGAYCWMAMVFVIDHNWLAMRDMNPAERDGILASSQAISFLSFAPTAVAVIAMAILAYLRGHKSA